jgi:hypothetical protein
MMIMKRPFHRFKSFMAEMVAALSVKGGVFDEVYKSRGHGGKHKPNRSRPSPRRFGGKYSGHVGERQIKRQLSQGLFNTVVNDFSIMQQKKR